MINPWFKFYAGEFLTDLDLKFDEFTETEIACWLILLCYAGVSEKPGTISHLTEEKLIKKAKVKDILNAAGIFKKFKNLGMITDDNGLITITKWEKRQENSMTGYERVKKYRDKKRMITDDNGLDNVVEEKREEKNKKEEIKKKLNTATEVASTPKKKKNPEDPMTCLEFVKWCRESNQKHILVIGEWAEAENPNHTTYGEWQSFIKRNLHAAQNLTAFDVKKIEKAYQLMLKDVVQTVRGKKVGFLTKYSLETVGKYIDLV